MMNIAERKENHYRTLRNNKHRSVYLQNAFNLYGEQSFVFDILEFCEKEKLIEREQFWIDDYKIRGEILYNIRLIADSNFGLKRSEETRRKISKSQKGKQISEETRRKLSEINTGNHCSEETKAKMSIAKKGKPFSEEHKKNISIAKKGKPHKRKYSKIE